MSSCCRKVVACQFGSARAPPVARQRSILLALMTSIIMDDFASIDVAEVMVFAQPRTFRVECLACHKVIVDSTHAGAVHDYNHHYDTNHPAHYRPVPPVFKTEPKILTMVRCNRG